MQEDIYKEVYFGQYCKKCVNFDKMEDEQPCRDCLNEPVNLYSHKPVNWEPSKGNEDYVAPIEKEES